MKIVIKKDGTGIVYARKTNNIVPLVLGDVLFVYWRRGCGNVIGLKNGTTTEDADTYSMLEKKLPKNFLRVHSKRDMYDEALFLNIELLDLQSMFPQESAGKFYHAYDSEYLNRTDEKVYLKPGVDSHYVIHGNTLFFHWRRRIFRKVFDYLFMTHWKNKTGVYVDGIGTEDPILKQGIDTVVKNFNVIRKDDDGTLHVLIKGKHTALSYCSRKFWEAVEGYPVKTKQDYYNEVCIYIINHNNVLMPEFRTGNSSMHFKDGTIFKAFSGETLYRYKDYSGMDEWFRQLHELYPDRTVRNLIQVENRVNNYIYRSVMVLLKDIFVCKYTGRYDSMLATPQGGDESYMLDIPPELLDRIHEYKNFVKVEDLDGKIHYVNTDYLNRELLKIKFSCRDNGKQTDVYYIGSSAAVFPEIRINEAEQKKLLEYINGGN